MLRYARRTSRAATGACGQEWAPCLYCQFYRSSCALPPLVIRKQSTVTLCSGAAGTNRVVSIDPELSPRYIMLRSTDASAYRVAIEWFGGRLLTSETSQAPVHHSLR